MKRLRPVIPKVPVYTSVGSGRRVKTFLCLAPPDNGVIGDDGPGTKKPCNTCAVDAPMNDGVTAGPESQQSQHTHYEQAKTKELEKWKQLRPMLIQTGIENSSPVSTSCSVCKEACTRILRCQDCNVNASLCHSCFDRIHRDLNMFHLAEEWKDGAFWPVVTLWHLKKDTSCCNSSQPRHLTVWDCKGRPNMAYIEFCSCEEECQTLLRNGLWPATPDRPRVAYSCELLDWLEAFMLECHVSTVGFVNALRWKNAAYIRDQFQSLYRVLVSESYEEYRHFKFRLQNAGCGTDSYPDISCPACPKDSGDLFLSVDANFGLVQKKRSTSTEPAKHGDSLFLSQQHVDQFVQEYGNKDRKIKGGECNNFQAGDKVRSKIKSQKLRFTGIMGCACKHEIPLLFLNLRHGERLAYVIHLMNELEKHKGENVKFHMLYDIACVLDTHLRRTKQVDKLGKFRLAIPVFHCYGHQASCQMKYNPRRLAGFGLLDGENMERLWSYLRGFNKITKEMTPAHRLDLLTDALLYWRKKKLDSLDKVLVQKMERARRQMEVYAESLNKVLQTHSPIMDGLTKSDVQRWLEDEQVQLKAVPAPKQKDQLWQESYVCHLMKLAELRLQMRGSEDADEIMSHSQECCILEREVKETERKRKIQTRWQVSDPEYIQAQTAYQHRLKQKLLNKLHGQAQDLQYLISLRAKYPDGQAIAGRLSRQIRTVTTSMRKACVVYNSKNFAALDDPLPDKIMFEEISKPEDQVFDLLVDPRLEEAVPRKVKREAIDLLNLYQRAEEDVSQIPGEMEILFKNYIKLHEHWTSCLLLVTADDSRNKLGEKAMLVKRINDVALRIEDMKAAFSQYSAEIETFRIPNAVNLGKHLEADSLDVDNVEHLRVEEIQDCYETNEEAWEVDISEDNLDFETNHEEDA